MIIFGILNHELDRNKDNSKNIIHIIDTFLAHLAFVCTLYDSYTYTFMNISLFNTFMFFVLEYMFPKYDHIFHMMIHDDTCSYCCIDEYLFYLLKRMNTSSMFSIIVQYLIFI